MSHAMMTMFLDRDDEDGDKPEIIVSGNCEDRTIVCIWIRTSTADLTLHVEDARHAIEIGEHIAREARELAGKMAERNRRNEEASAAQAEAERSTIAYAAPEILQEMVNETLERR